MESNFLLSGINSSAVAILAVWFSLGYLSFHTDAPKGITFIRDAFVILFFNKLFIFAQGSVPISIWLFVDISAQIAAAVMLAAGALQLKNIVFPKQKALFIAVVAGSFISGIITNTGSIYFEKLAHYGSVAVGFALLALGFLRYRISHRHKGFIFVAGVLGALALFYITKITNIGETLDAYGVIQPTLLGLLSVSIIMLTSNLLWIQIDTMQEEIDLGRSRLEQIVLSSPFPIMISRLRDDHLLLINEKSANLFNISMYNSDRYRTVDFYADPSNRNELISQLEKNPVVENFEILVRPKGSTESFWLLVSARIIDYNYEIAVYTAFQDITERKQKELKLYDQATRDPLTGCYNRRSFDEMVVKEVYKARRTKRPFCVFMIDADHFKKVNDNYGHGAGDRVLKALASCCRRTLRESDIIARFGGEEFVVFMPDTKIEMAFKVCDRLRINVSDLIVKGDDNEDIKFTISIGLVESTQDDDLNMDNLLKISDGALYIAKRSGRNRVIIGEKNQDITIASEASEVKSLVEMEAVTDDIPLDNDDITNVPSLKNIEGIHSTEEIDEPPLPEDDYDVGKADSDILYSGENEESSKITVEELDNFNKK